MASLAIFSNGSVSYPWFFLFWVRYFCSEHLTKTGHKSHITIITFQKESQNTPWNNYGTVSQCLNFFISNLKTDFISQSNIILACIWNINHTSQVTNCCDMTILENYSEFFRIIAWFGNGMVVGGSQIKMQKNTWFFPMLKKLRHIIQLMVTQSWSKKSPLNHLGNIKFCVTLAFRVISAKQNSTKIFYLVPALVALSIMNVR